MQTCWAAREMPKHEPEGHRAKTFETLYALGHSLLAEERSRFADAEEKLQRHSTLLIAAIGAGTFILELAKPSIQIPSSGTEWMLLLSVVVFYASSVSGLLFSVWGLRVSSFPTLSATSALPDFFLNQTYVTVLFSMSKRLMEAVGDARSLNNRKFRLVQRSSNCLLAAVAFGLFFFLLLSFNLMEASPMMEPINETVEVAGGGSGESGGEEAPSSEPETGTDAPENDTSFRSEPDPSAEAPANVTVDKIEKR